MTIRPGEPWGEVVTRPVDVERLDSDHELARRHLEGPQAAAMMTGGDLLAAVGGRSTGDTVRRYPIDVVAVTLDDDTATAVAHVVARRAGPLGWWRGPLVAVLNVGNVATWDVAPRAHPNDGRLDVVEVDPAMSLRARWQARRRLPTGTHLPHPQIRTSRPTTATWTFDGPLTVWVDGVRRGRTRSLAVEIEPDAAVMLA